MKTPGKQQGFTLLELLLVMVLGSVILFGMFQLFFTFKRVITNYHQMIRLQTSIRAVTYELYQVFDKAGRFGCANTNQPLYLHLAKKNLPFLKSLLVVEENKLMGLKILPAQDFLIKTFLPAAIYKRLRHSSSIIYLIHTAHYKKHELANFHPVYADCQDVFVLSSDMSADYFINKPNFYYQGNFEVSLYFVANSQRKNSQGSPIYSLYRYNSYLGTQEILEGVEMIQADKSSANKIKVLLNSVEGNLSLWQWLIVEI